MENNSGVSSFKSKSEEERFKQYQLQRRMEEANGDIAKIEWDLLSITIEKGVLKDNCKAANALGLGGIVVLPVMVKPCEGFLGRYPNCDLIAAISYPTGGDTTDVKVAALKRAYKDGADEFEIYAPAAAIKEGNYSYFKKECKKLRKVVKTRAIRIAFDCTVFTAQELTKACTILADVGINGVRLNRVPDADLVRKITNVTKNKLLLKVDRVENVSTFESAISLGATKVSCSNAVELTTAILNKAKE